MIEKLDVHSSQGGYLSLILSDPNSGYIVQEIQGLDPVKATLVTSSFAQQDGSQYQSSKRESRNILLKLGIEPDWVAGSSVRSLRSQLYSVFMPKTAVDLSFLMSDELEVTISGRVESFESAMFTEEPVVDISVMCFDPDFIEPNVIVQNGTTTSGSSFSNFDYDGTVESGVTFKIMVDRTMTGFTIYHQASDGSLRSMDFQAPLVADDVVTISTVSGNKYATLRRSSSDSSILYGVSPQANWLELTPGVNGLRVYAEGASVPYTMQYVNRHGGL